MKILFLGFGSIALKHLNVLKTLLPESEFLALRTNEESKRIENVRNIYSYKEIPLDTDFFIVSSPTIHHFEQINVLKQYKKPIFIEKPCVHELNEETYKLADDLVKEGIPTYVAFNLRFHPCIIYLKNFLERNKPRINELNVYCGSFLPDWRTGRDFRTVYSANKKMGGGVHLDLIHELDYTHYLLGSPLTSYSFLKSKSSLDIDSVDYAHYYWDYSNFSATITLNYYRKQPKRIIEIITDDNIIIVDLINFAIKDQNQKIIFNDERKNILETYKQQMIYFIDAITNKKEIENNFKNSLKVLELCLNSEIC